MFPVLFGRVALSSAHCEQMHTASDLLVALDLGQLRTGSATSMSTVHRAKGQQREQPRRRHQKTLVDIGPKPLHKYQDRDKIASCYSAHAHRPPCQQRRRRPAARHRISTTSAAMKRSRAAMVRACVRCRGSAPKFLCWRRHLAALRLLAEPGTRFRGVTR